MAESQVALFFTTAVQRFAAEFQGLRQIGHMCRLPPLPIPEISSRSEGGDTVESTAPHQSSPSKRYLADALDIGSTLHLSDELSPGICRHPTGRFCVIMPMRVTIAARVTREIEAAPSPQAQAA
jgi:hypothetical protein